MSLFNVCHWWSTQCSDLDENYDVASLLCARFGLADEEKDYIVVGSHGGHLSIYYPSYELDQTNDRAIGYRATDLLFEQQQSMPILGVYAGRFSANNRKENSNQLAVLHPLMVVIYNLQSIGSQLAEHGAQLCLQQLQVHRFRHTAFTLCKGHFGHVKGREFFAVVHLNGSMTFYEQDGITYECQFPADVDTLPSSSSYFLPAPVIYSQRTDSFCRVSSTWNLECFTYQDLCQWSINQQGHASFRSVWSVCLGEGVLDMNVVQVKSAYASITILGERNFMCLTDNGKVEFILKLDYTPRCYYSFVIGYYWEEDTARLITIIVSTRSEYFVYENANIIWAARDEGMAPPVAILRSNLCGLPGGIVTLGERGQLKIGYLGSEAFVFDVPPLEREECLQLPQLSRELKRLELEIKSVQDVQNMEECNRQAEQDLELNISIDRNRLKLDADLDQTPADLSAQVALLQLPVALGVLKWSSQCDLIELQLIFHLAEGLSCSQDTISYQDVKAQTMEEIPLQFYVSELVPFHTAQVEVLASFINTKGIPRIVRQSDWLPLNMFYDLRAVQDNTATIDHWSLIYDLQSNEMDLEFIEHFSLSSLFPEFNMNFDYNDDNEESCGFIPKTSIKDPPDCPESSSKELQNIVSVIFTKNIKRLRIQSNCLVMLPMILERVITTTRSINLKDSKLDLLDLRSGNKLLKMMEPTLPKDEILELTDIHHRTQENIQNHTTELDKLWQDFKGLQKRLGEISEENIVDEASLKKSLLKDIDHSYDQLIAEGDRLMEIRQQELKIRCDLSCAIALLKLILLNMSLESKLLNVILSVFSTPVEDWSELSWEESMSGGIDMLHNYGPLNRTNNLAHLSNVGNASIDINTFDYQLFRQQFEQLMERIIIVAGGKKYLKTKRKSNLQELQTIQDIDTTEFNVSNVKSVEVVEDPVQEIGQKHEILNVQPMRKNTGAIRKLHPIEINRERRGNTFIDVQHLEHLESVEDDDDVKRPEEDMDDLSREVGYRKTFIHDTDKKIGEEKASSDQSSSYDRTIPINEKLFSDLGIWW